MFTTILLYLFYIWIGLFVIYLAIMLCNWEQLSSQMMNEIVSDEKVETDEQAEKMYNFALFILPIVIFFIGPPLLIKLILTGK